MSERLILSYRLLPHALDRMLQRKVSMAEVLFVLDNPTNIEQAYIPGRIHYESQVAGRLVRVTVDAFDNTIVTVVTPGSTAAKSPYGWFSLGAGLEARR